MQAQKISGLKQEPFGLSSPSPAKGGSLSAPVRGGQRLAWIDVARGLAALSVTAYHFQIGNGFAHALHLPWLVWMNWPGSTLAVPVFFVISGFSIHYAERGKIQEWRRHPAVLPSYLLRRLWRIYPPYLAALLLAMSLNRLQGRPTSGADLTAHLALIHQFFPAYFNSIDVVLWSIGVEMWLYLLYPFAFLLSKRWGLWTAGSVIFLVSAASVASTAAVSHSHSAVGLWFVLNLLFGWCLGAALAEGYATGNLFFLSNRWWLLGAGLLVLQVTLTITGAYQGLLWPVRVPALVVLSAWLLTILLILERRRAAQPPAGHGRLLGALRGLGLISYSLYLVHEPLINIRDLVLRQVPWHSMRTTVFCLWYAVPFLAAWLCWLLVEKPSMRISKRLKAATV
jgi:peptidoglycan/LPS O-acetylase OafA/YrhL